MELIHYGEKPFVYDPARRYDQNEPHGYGKPVGLWCSVRGVDEEDWDWPAWCHAEEFREHALAHASRIVLSPQANVLHLSTGETLEEFHLSYSVETEFEKRTRDWASPTFIRHQWPIDWDKVTADHQGLIIAPYLDDQRFGPAWYYGWDCASGCIWDLEAIASVEEVCAEEEDKSRGQGPR